MEVFLFLAFAGAVYWYVRQNGELKFYIDGHSALSKELDDIILSHWKKSPPQSSNFDLELSYKLEDHISTFMDEHYWPRFKAYDLMHTVQRNIKNIQHNQNEINITTHPETRAYEIGKVFKQVIEQHDKRGKRYRDSA